MNINKQKRIEIKKLRRTGLSINKIFKMLFPRAHSYGHRFEPIARVCKGVKFYKKPSWLQAFR